MNRKITTECPEELYNGIIKPYVDKGYDESDVSAVLMMYGAAYLENNSNMRRDFERYLGIIRFGKLLGEMFK